MENGALDLEHTIFPPASARRTTYVPEVTHILPGLPEHYPPELESCGATVATATVSLATDAGVSTVEPPAGDVLDALPVTIWATDLEGRITATSGLWSNFARENDAAHLESSHSVIGKSVLDTTGDPGIRDQIERAMILLRERRAPMMRWEFPCDSPTEKRVFLMNVNPLVSQGEIYGFVFSTVDITSSHRSREALIHTGMALSEAISLDRVYAEVANQLRHAVSWNGFAMALSDGEHGDLQLVYRDGYNASDVSNSMLASRLKPMWRNALAKGEVVLDHTPFGLELTAPLIGSQGVKGAITIDAESIESEQALEESMRVLGVIAAQTIVAVERALLVRRVEDKRRLEAIGEVSAGVAHELRNPLFGISSAAQLIQFRAPDDATVERNVGRILSEVERLNRMVTSLLEFGRPSKSNRTRGNPDTVWDDIIEGERARLAKKSLKLERQRNSSLTALFDAEQLGQVFRNVLANACEAAPEGGVLKLVSGASDGAGAGWSCQLVNGGLPIAPDALPHVFEFFFSARLGGTGIGLALCKRIIDEHGGSISLESSIETGTVLSIRLPPLACP